MTRADRLRGFYARYVAAKAAIDDARVIAAFAAVPREPFAGPPPWHILAISPWGEAGRGSGYVVTPDGDPAYLYQDVLVALDPARHINMGEPSLHARCLAALDVRPGETVLHVGAGSGYYSSILAELVGPGGHVHAYEIDPALAARAAANLAPRPNATLHARSGIAPGLPAADAIYVSAGLSEPSAHWLAALRPGGRLLFPMQPPGSSGAMLLVRREGERWPARFICRAGFIPCVAPRDDDMAERLEEAFAAGTWRDVRRLRHDAPDESCWVRGDGWWLSTRE